MTVKAVDGNAWADDDYIIVGEIGTETSEILQVKGAVSEGTSLAIDNQGSGGSRYAHSIDEPVYRIDFNRIEFSRATTKTGSKTVLNTIELQTDDLFTRYEDSANATGFGFVRFVNGAVFSEYSGAIPYTGYSKKSLGRIIKMIRRHLDEPDFRDLEDEDIIEEVNEKQRDIAHERLWPFYEDVFSDSIISNQNKYDLNSDVVDGKAHTIVVRTDPMAKMDRRRFNMLQWDTATVSDPTHAHVWQNQIILWPVRDTAAATDALNGGISASDVTITVDDVSVFTPSGRVIIESEVISYTNTNGTNNTLLGCLRGLEGTTAATHADDVVVTERDIVYTAHREPDELRDIDDETKIPDPLVLVYGSAMEIALGRLHNQGLHDRMKVKYDESMARLRDKFGRKLTSGYYKIKDKDDVVTDTGRFVNPNDFLRDIG